MINSLHSLRSEKSALKCLILIGLLCAQFAYASHQMTHGTDEFGESCEICAGYEQFENALSNDLYAALIPAIGNALPPCPAVFASTNGSRFYSARASPQTLNSSF